MIGLVFSVHSMVFEPIMVWAAAHTDDYDTATTTQGYTSAVVLRISANVENGILLAETGRRNRLAVTFQLAKYVAEAPAPQLSHGSPGFALHYQPFLPA